MSLVLRSFMTRLVTWFLFELAIAAVILHFFRSQMTGDYWIALVFVFLALLVADFFLALRRMLSIALHHFLTVETRTLALMREFRVRELPKDVAGQEWQTYSANALGSPELTAEGRDLIIALNGSVEGMRTVSVSAAVMVQNTLDRAILRYLAQ